MTSQIITLTPTSYYAAVNTTFGPDLISCINFSPWPLVINYSNATPDENSFDLYLPPNASSVFPAIGRAFNARLLLDGLLPEKVLPCYVVFTDEPLYTHFGQLVDPLQGVNVTMLVRMQPVDYNSGDQNMAGGFAGVIHTYTIPAGFFGVLRAANLLLGTSGAGVRLTVLVDGFEVLILVNDPAAAEIWSERLAWEVPCPAGTVIDLQGVNGGGGLVAYAASWFVDLIPLT